MPCTGRSSSRHETRNRATSLDDGNASVSTPPQRNLAPIGRAKSVRVAAIAATVAGIAASHPAPRGTSRKAVTVGEIDVAASATSRTTLGPVTGSEAAAGRRTSVSTTSAALPMWASKDCAAAAALANSPSRTTLIGHGASPATMDVVSIPTSSSSCDAVMMKRPSIQACGPLRAARYSATASAMASEAGGNSPGVVDEPGEQYPPRVEHDGAAHLASP